MLPKIIKYRKHFKFVYCSSHIIIAGPLFAMDGRRKLQFDDEKQQADVKQEADEKKKRMKSKKQMKCEEEAQTDRQKLRKTGYHQTGTFSI